MFYESQNSLGRDMVKLETGTDFSFPSHMHDAFELICITEGVMTITIDNIQYSVEAGNAVLVFPNQVHSLTTLARSRHILCIFSPDLVKAYQTVYTDQVPTSNLFIPEPSYVHILSSENLEGRLTAKGILYLLCAQFDSTAQYHPRSINRAGLLAKIFQFVEDHFREDCSLAALTQSTGYHSVYLSRYFKQTTGLVFTDYVVQCRIREAAYLLKNTRDKMLDIAFSCGFRSLRSFHRSFRKVMGIAPSRYRQES